MAAGGRGVLVALQVYVFLAIILKPDGQCLTHFSSVKVDPDPLSRQTDVKYSGYGRYILKDFFHASRPNKHFKTQR